MLTKNGNMTPREAAHEIATGYIRLAHEGTLADVEGMDNRPSVQRAIKKQLAKLHNGLLLASGLDGLNIGEEK